MNLKKLFATSATFALAVSLFAPVINTAKADYNAEIKGAYDYAYSQSVTTLPSVNAANPMGTAIRGHVAKMISNWGEKVLNLKVAENATAPAFNDIASESVEIQGFIVKAAKLGLMGQSNGGYATSFNPKAKVSRAQFGTMLSRALWGEKNNGGTPYYTKHLEALKAAGIMNNISNPERPVLRYEIWLMLQRTAGKVVVKEGPDTDPMALLNCLLDSSKTTEDCMGETKKPEPKPEPKPEEPTIVKKGEVSVKLAKSTPDERIPVGVSRVPMTKFVVSAGNEDVKLYSITVDNLGLGDSKEIEEVAIYNEDNVEVSKSTKNFGSKEDISINFVKGLTVKAKGSETFTVVAKIDAGDSTSYGLKVTELNSSAKDIDGLPVKGNVMDTINATNIAKVKIDGGNEGGKLEAGEEKTLASFKVEEQDKGDTEVLSVKLTIDGDDDVEFDNLTLYADGKEVKDAKFERNAKDELTVTMDYEVKQDKKVEFKVKGSVVALSDDAFKFVIASANDVYVKDADKGYNAKVTLKGGDSEEVSNDWKTEGAEITASFKRADRDEIKDDSEDVLFGTLTLKSNGTNYTLEDYVVKVTVPTGKKVKEIVSDLKLGSASYDKVTGDDGVTASYKFDEIDLRANETVKLPIILDIAKDLDDGITVDVDADITGKLVNEDEDEDVKSADFNGTFSSTNFSSKKITIEKPTLTFSKKTLKNRNIILGNQEEVVYKAKVSIGDADDVELKDIAFTATVAGGTADLDELIQGATLTIGGKEYSEDDISATKVSFSSIGHKFAAGESNVDVFLNVTMKSKDGFNGNIKFTPVKVDFDAEDMDGDAVKLTVTETAGPVLTLSDHGTLTMSVYTEDENGTVESQSVEFDKSVVAGSEAKVVLGKLKLKAERENMKIKELKFEGDDVAAKFENSVVDFSLTIGDSEDLGAYKTETRTDANKMTLVFENIDYTLEEGKIQYATVYAKIKKLDLDDSATDSAELGAKLDKMGLVAAEYEGVDSGDDEGEIVATLPTGKMKSTTVSASNIASMELVKVSKALVESEQEVAQLKIVATKTENVDADGEKIYPWLKTLTADNFEIAGSKGVAATITKIEKVGGSKGAQALGADLTALGDDAEINGTVTYKIYANVTALGNADAPYVQVKLKDKTAPVFAQYEGATETVKFFVPKGTSKDQTVNTK